MKENSRRRFLKGTIGTLGGTILARIAGLFPEVQAMLAQSTHEAIPSDIARPRTQLDVDELYEGFLILPRIDSPFSSQEGISMAEREIIEFDSLSAALEHTDIPLYLPSFLPDELELSKVSLQRYRTSLEPYLVTVSYSSSEVENQTTVMSVSARSNFPRPYPIRPVHLFHNSSEPELLFPDRVISTPTPGVMLPSVAGYGLHWIEKDILYTLMEEYTVDRDSVINLVRSLEKNN